ncbi:hypothetical protein [Virgibacillus sp. YIM 98842]|jgi:hypothetical protein|uniref:hypothetical protein n=1 Tax=Virgibacillus sp. YIM 98842 TaxID=2663533 RepID=UPI0013DAF23F|nr:hypothetical protein [Virgibacillus sp. YIM 98842]
MNYEGYIRQSLYLRELPAYQADIPIIHKLFCEMNQSAAYLHAFPNLNMETPITIVDKELMK